MQMTAALDARPSWRGRMHAWAFLAAVPAGVLLVVVADGAAARTAASIYAATLLLVFGTSAAYHRLAGSPRARAVMQRLDHSMIYLLIAGTYVPLCVVALPASWGIPVLAVVGAGAVAGMVIKLTAFHRRRAHLVGSALYPVLGWAAVVAAPALAVHLTPVQLGLVVAGGVAYTVGFPVLLLRRPDPWPTRFGYHEVWHTCTVVAAGLHFAAVGTIVG
jgi:hemolysin III